MKQSSIISLDELPAFAVQYSRLIRPHDVVALVGELGSGKSTFVFHLLQVMGLGKGQPFSSPTFVILNQYRLKERLLNHVDLYRLNSYQEFESLDIERLFCEPHAVTFIEWGDKFVEMVKLFTKKIYFEYVPEYSSKRKISWGDSLDKS